MHYCCVLSCRNRSKSIGDSGEISFFRLPKEKSVADKWINFCGRDVSTLKDARVCSAHFEPQFLIKRPVELYDNAPRVLLAKGAIPSVIVNSEQEVRKRKRRQALKNLSPNTCNIPQPKRINHGHSISSFPLLNDAIGINPSVYTRDVPVSKADVNVNPMNQSLYTVNPSVQIPDSEDDSTSNLCNCTVTITSPPGQDHDNSLQVIALTNGAIPAVITNTEPKANITKKRKVRGNICPSVSNITPSKGIKTGVSYNERPVTSSAAECDHSMSSQSNGEVHIIHNKDDEGVSAVVRPENCPSKSALDHNYYKTSSSLLDGRSSISERPGTLDAHTNPDTNLVGEDCQSSNGTPFHILISGEKVKRRSREMLDLREPAHSLDENDACIPGTCDEIENEVTRRVVEYSDSYESFHGNTPSIQEEVCLSAQRIDMSHEPVEVDQETTQNLDNSENENLKNENAALKEEIAELKETIEKMTKKKRNAEKELSKRVEEQIYSILSPVFTVGQIRKLLHPNKKHIKWSADDITSAIALRSVSPKGYRYLSKKRNVPLPALSTLRRWAAKVEVEPGMVSSVIENMKKSAAELSVRNRLCILTFDEVYISQNIEIDPKKQKKFGPHKRVQVGMVRSLFGTWKQVVYFSYDEALTKNIVNNVIGQLHDAGYTVVGLTTDLGSSNQGLWTSLGISADDEEKCFFVHPREPDLKVFVFADAPHLLKSTRNNFVDHGMQINGKRVDKRVIEELLTFNSGELKVAFKISRKHLDVKGSERQNVGLAAQLLSDNTGNAIEWFGQRNFYQQDYNWKECSDVIKTTNDWFDLFNSKRKFGKKTCANAYGVNLEEQNALLDKMSKMMREARYGNHRSLLPSQKGIIVSNNSLKGLLKYLQQKYATDTCPIDYIMTYRLNQDILENFFSFIRGMGATNVKPSSLQFKYRLKWYILGKHSRDMFTENRNTEEDEDETLIDAASISFESGQANEEAIMQVLGDGDYCEQMQWLQDTVHHDASQHHEDMAEDTTVGLPEIEYVREVVEEEALIYISGYVASRFRVKYPQLGTPTRQLPNTQSSNWTCHISRGSLLYPSDSMLKTAFITEEIFNAFHGTSLSNSDLIFEKIAQQVKREIKNRFDIPYEVILCLVRTRTYIRLREMNKQWKNAYNKLRIAERAAKDMKFFS